MAKTLLRPDEVAKYLRVKIRSIYRWERLGLLRGHRLPGGTLRFKLEDVEEFLRHKTSQNCTKDTKSSQNPQN